MLRRGSTWGALSAPTVTFRDMKPLVFTKLGNKYSNTVTVSIQQKYSNTAAKTCCISAVLLYLVPTHVVFAAVLIQQSECCMIQQLQQYSSYSRGSGSGGGEGGGEGGGGEGGGEGGGGE